jgi:hypothetical protein
MAVAEEQHATARAQVLNFTPFIRRLLIRSASDAFHTVVTAMACARAAAIHVRRLPLSNTESSPCPVSVSV